MKVLVIAAHPDDEVLGVGGTIAKLSSEGNEVYVHIVTDGSSTQYAGDETKLKEKQNEALKANEILGVKKVYFGNLPDMKLDIIPHIEINKELERVISEVKPEMIFTHHGGDVNKDHKLIFEATLVAARPVKGSIIKELYTYETASSTEWGDTSSKDYFIPNTFYDISNFIDIKCKALEEYKTEIRDYPHPRSIQAIKNYANFKGNKVGYDFGEAFRLVRKLR